MQVLDRTLERPKEMPKKQYFCQLAVGYGKIEHLNGVKMMDFKYDGIRALAVLNPSTGEVNIFSRNWERFENFKEIKNALKKTLKFFSEPVVLDGEIVGSNYQEVLAQVHRKNEVSTESARFVVFDMLSLEEFELGKSEKNLEQRHEELMELRDSIEEEEELPQIYFMDKIFFSFKKKYPEQTKRILGDLVKKVVNLGYEGVMLKDPSSYYKRERSRAWIKVKPKMDLTFSIVGFQEGRKKHKNRLGALHCVGTWEGKELRVSVSAGFKDILREEIWQNQELYLNKKVDIQCDKITQNKDGDYSLRFPRFFRFREEN